MPARRRIAAFAAVVMIGATLGVVGTGSPAAGEDPPVVSLPPFPADVGVLRLHLGGDGDYFRFDAADGSGGYTAGTAEPLVVSSCNIGAPLPASVSLTALPESGRGKGKLGLVDDGIGVQVKGEGNGSPCGQANGPDQGLRLSLAGPLADKELDFAELDIEGKFGVTVRAELFHGGVSKHVETLATGGPDSGPDSADGDNFRWRLPAASAGLVVFDTIVLTVHSSTPTGAFSLEGGADGTAPEPGGLGAALATTDSLFHVTDIDGTMQCGDTVTEGGSGTPSASITLVDGDNCQPVMYSLDTSAADDEAGAPQSFLFQKDADDFAVFRATVVWEVEAAAYPVGATQIDYGDGQGPHTMLWCGGTAEEPVVPTGEFWCLLDHHATQAGDGLMQVTEEYYGEGDPFGFR